MPAEVSTLRNALAPLSGSGGSSGVRGMVRVSPGLVELVPVAGTNATEGHTLIFWMSERSAASAG